VAGVSRSGYYRWLSRGLTGSEDVIKIIAFEQARLCGILGYRSMKRLLKKKYQINIGGNRLLKIMRDNKLQAVIRRKRRKYQNQITREKLTAPNLLNREFTSKKPGEKYVTDITYIPIPNSMVYLSVILDLYNSEVVEYKLSQSADASLSLDVVRKLAAKRDLKGAMLHSDQGVHYTNKDYHNLLKENGLVASMSRKGNCWDNAVMENFFSHFKSECYRIKKKAFRTYQDVVEIVEDYINYYNLERTQERLNGLSPIAYRGKTA